MISDNWWQNTGWHDWEAKTLDLFQRKHDKQAIQRLESMRRTQRRTRHCSQHLGQSYTIANQFSLWCYTCAWNLHAQGTDTGAYRMVNKTISWCAKSRDKFTNCTIVSLALKNIRLGIFVYQIPKSKGSSVLYGFYLTVNKNGSVQWETASWRPVQPYF